MRRIRRCAGSCSGVRGCPRRSCRGSGGGRAGDRRGRRAARPAGGVTLVAGPLSGPRLERVVASIPGARARVAAVPNGFFGGSVAVAGLLTGQDIAGHLASLPALGEAVIVPAVALRERDGVFLDDMTVADLSAALGI